jgi:multidrug efflux pump subunit AcrA (membrane-fusion protein)
MRIVVQVSESAVRHLRTGQHAKITFPAIPGYHVDGTLDRVEPAAVRESGHVYYLADLALPNGAPNPRLLPGMTADATF